MVFLNFFSFNVGTTNILQFVLSTIHYNIHNSIRLIEAKLKLIHYLSSFKYGNINKQHVYSKLIKYF